jgi:long-chain acyl-CoA synthetase
VERWPGQPAFLSQQDGQWRSTDYAGADHLVQAAAGGFQALGIGKGDRVAILARPTLEWTVSDWALLSIGAVVVPVYPTSSTGDVRHVLAHSGARALICEQRADLERVEALRPELPALDHAVLVDGGGSVAGDALSFDALLESGRAAAEAPAASIEPGDTASIVYTSGTTGVPKGCVITHANVAAAVRMILDVPDLLREGEVALMFLPLAHVYGRIVQWMGAGAGLTLAFCPDVARVAHAAAATRPQILPTVPRLLEKVHAAVLANVESGSGAKRALGRFAIERARRASELRQEGRAPGLGLRLQLALADRLVLAKIRGRLGGRVRVAVSGGAALPPGVGVFFDSLGMDLVEGYGMTEATGVLSVGVPGRHRIGSVGPPLSGLEARLDDDGEVLVRGESVFAGYEGDEAATAEVLTDDGWLRTGDLGTIDDGIITLIERKKEIMVTAAGKNVAPQRVENALVGSPFVSQAIAVGDERPFVGALLVLDEEMGAKLGAGRSAEELAKEAVEDANAQLGDAERVRKFSVLPAELSIETGELTSSLKLRRKVIHERHAGEIEELFAGRV